MPQSTAEQLRFPPVEGLSVRAEFDGGALSSDFGPLLLRGVDQQLGLSSRLADAVRDRRDGNRSRHSLQALFAQRIYQIACGYEDANDANHLRKDPMFKLALERKPLDADADLASAPTFSRLENAMSRQDLYRLAQEFVEQFIASYPEAPALIVLDMDHSEDPTHGQQEFCFYNHHYRHHCYLPLFVFEGISGKFITAVLRPGKTPKGVENAMIVKRILQRLRSAWPTTHIILRGDSHFANPELMALLQADPHLDFIFGLAANQLLLRQARPWLEQVRVLHQQRCHHAHRNDRPAPTSTQTYHEFDYAAVSWSQTYRVVLKAQYMSRGENPRFVVTSLSEPTPECLYRDLYCARGQDENFIKMVKCDLAADRTSDHGFLANHLRLFFSCAAYVLHHALRTQVLAHTELRKAQPATVILKLFKLAVRVVQYKDRVKLHLPSHCPVKALLQTATEILFLVRAPSPDTS